MSNFLAIATVTETLRYVLEAAVNADVVGAIGTAVRPSGTNNTGAGGGLPTTGVNVFLYQLMPNAAARNLDLPTRRSDASPIQSPRAAIDLHYMFSVYGQESTLEPQRVMGSVIRTLSSRPILTRQTIDEAVLGAGHLAGSDLSTEIETVKLTPLSLTLDELSRVWSVFFQTSYALSVCYQASVVFLEDSTPVSAALPVRTPNIVAVPMASPVIERIAPQPALAGDTVTISGTNVGRHVPFVRLGEAEPVAATVLSPSRIQLKLPPTTQAGVTAVRVVQKIDLGTGDPAEPHLGFESNIAGLALAPRITSPVSGASLARGTKVTITVDAPVGRDQRVSLVLGSRGLPIPQRPISDPDVASSFDVPLPADLSTGDTLMRLQVDGVDSPLQVDAAGVYVEPKVTIA